MKQSHSKLAATVLCTLVATILSPALRAADLSEADKQFLTRYEQVRAALAADDLALAKKVATDLGDDGAAIARADSILSARNQFATLSERAVKLAAGQSDYYVVKCPMVKQEWVQPRGEISNPYAGRSMPTCGMIKKQGVPLSPGASP